MSVLLVHPGTQHSFALAQQLQRTGCLSEFWTGVALAEDGLVCHLINNITPKRWHRFISNRILAGVDSERIRLLLQAELIALLQQQFGSRGEQIFLQRNKRFQQQLPDTAIERSSGVIAFDTAGWIVGKRAIDKGIPFFLDRSSAHARTCDQIVARLADEFPDWNIRRNSRPQGLYDAEDREFELASRIIVASTFSRNTMIEHGINQDTLRLNPYGTDLTLFRPATERKRQHRKIRFLFVGTLSVGKGLLLLLDLWQGFNHDKAELSLAGPVDPEVVGRMPLLRSMNVLGKFAYRELPEVYRSHDVFVFPSYFDGFAQVLLEAMASGLPVITTDATAGPDLIEDGEQGFIIKAGDSESLAKAMYYFLDNPDEIQTMGMAARTRAEDYPWDRYGDRWRRILEEAGAC